jgi:hypothetical protein
MNVPPVPARMKPQHVVSAGPAVPQRPSPSQQQQMLFAEPPPVPRRQTGPPSPAAVPWAQGGRTPPVPLRAHSPQPARELVKFASFGVTLDEIMTAQSRAWPHEPLPRVLCTLQALVLSNGGATSEGIFRLSGNAAEVTRLRTELNKGAFDVVFVGDPNTPACVLKQWVGELREPLVPPRCAAPLLQSVRDNRPAAEIVAGTEALLPEVNRRVLRALLALLRQVLREGAVNRMTPASLALVWSPNVFGRGSDDGNPFAFMQNTQTQTVWMQTLLLSEF